MGRHRKTKGVCRLCGEEKELTYEHVPPRTAYNKNTNFVSLGFHDYIESYDPRKDTTPKGKKRQGGIGYNSLCSECNSFLGRNYVPAYKDWVDSGFSIIHKQSYKYVEYKAKSQQPLKVLKAIISMFLAMNKPWYLEAYPELSKFVKDPLLKNLPNRYRIFTYLTNEKKTKYMHHTIIYNPNLGGIVNHSEMAFPPFGYVLTIDFDKNINLFNNITYFKNFDLNEMYDIEMQMFNLSVQSPFPLDYRDVNQLKSDIEKSEELLK